MITRKKSFFSNPLVLVSLASVMAFAAACGGDDSSGGNPTPNGGSKATGGSGSTAGNKATGGSSAGKTGTPTAGTSPVEMGGGGAGPTPVVPDGGAGGAANCTDAADKDCYSCPAKTHDEFLNHCPTTGCEPFDNSVLTSIKNGKLPKLL